MSRRGTISKYDAKEIFPSVYGKTDTAAVYSVIFKLGR